MKKILIVLLVFIVQSSIAQHLYPEKYDNCKLSRFCLDCGEPQAEMPKDGISAIVNGLNEKALKKINGSIVVQVLVDTLGRTCLLSAENKTNVTSKKLDLQGAINSMPAWSPSMEESKPKNASVSLELIFNNGKFGVRRLIFDFKNNTNFKSVGKPDVEGSKSKDLSVLWSVFNQSNSDIPWDMTRAVVADNNVLWIGTDNGLVKMLNDNMEIYSVNNSAIRPVKYNKNRAASIRHASLDKEHNLWFSAGWDAYMFDGDNWTVFDSTNSPLVWPRKIYHDDFNNTYITSSRGLAKYDGKMWSVIDTSNSKLPSNKISSIYVDKDNRTWIGTFEGNIRIENNKIVEFGETDSPLKEGAISKMHEDSKGNFWFYLYCKDKTKAGIWLLKPNGEWTSVRPKKSELFTKNDVNDFLLDEENGVLWIALNSVGLIRYDIKNDKWETYTPENSNVPSVHVMKLAKDKEGIIWAATFAGVIKTEK